MGPCRLVVPEYDPAKAVDDRGFPLYRDPTRRVVTLTDGTDLPENVLPPDGGRKSESTFSAPSCTDNGMLVKFSLLGREWHSVDHCYQALRFTEDSPGYIAVAEMIPKKNEGKMQFGTRCVETGKVGMKGKCNSGHGVSRLAK